MKKYKATGHLRIQGQLKETTIIDRIIVNDTQEVIYEV